MKLRWLDRRIACPGPYLALCLTEAEFHAALRHCKVTARPPMLHSPAADATTHYLTNPKGQLVCAVCLGPHEDRNAIEVAGLLVHEAVHVWQEHSKNIGEATPAIEQEAYAIQSIAQELLAEYARRLAPCAKRASSSLPS